jgi:CHASE2 domain-containing sensor protein
VRRIQQLLLVLLLGCIGLRLAASLLAPLIPLLVVLFILASLFAWLFLPHRRL